MSNHEVRKDSKESAPQGEAKGNDMIRSGHGSSRRGFIRGGLVKAAYIAPAVATLAAPKTVFAASAGSGCGSVGATCVDDTDCCALMQCMGMTPECCGDVGFACTADGDCCGMSNCTGGFCD